MYGYGRPGKAPTTDDTDSMNEPRSGAPTGGDDSPDGPSEGHLEQHSTEEIIAELQRRQGRIHEAHARRTRLLQQLAEVEMEILRLGGSIPGRSTQPVGAPAPASNGGGSTAPGSVDLSGLTLPRAIAQVVRIGEVFSPKEATERLREAGYRTRAQHFNTAVTQALGRDNHFRRVGHGRYERVG